VAAAQFLQKTTSEGYRSNSANSANEKCARSAQSGCYRSLLVGITSGPFCNLAILRFSDACVCRVLRDRCLVAHH